MVSCEICGREMNFLPPHIKTHGMTCEHYGELFPDSNFCSEEYSKHLSESNSKEAYRRWGTDEWKDMQSVNRKRLWKEPEYREKTICGISLGMKQKWLDENFALRVVTSLSFRPTKSEKILDIDLQELFPNKWRYVGDGSLWIGHPPMNPDFVMIEENKVIEIFGDYWHRNDDPQDRINKFEKFGYKAIVIWEHELKDIPKVLDKIINFMFNNE